MRGEPRVGFHGLTELGRAGIRGPLFAVLFVSVVALAPSIFLGNVPAQTDWLPTYGPWGKLPWTADSVKRFNPGGGDDFFVYLPDRIAALNEWRSGRVPLWNPYTSGGVPFLGMQTANPLDPLIVLELTLPLGYAMGLEYALLLFIAGLGVVLYLREQGLRNNAALALAGITFALNPYFIVWLENRVFVAGLATLPIALWALDRIMIHGQSTRRDAAVLALALGYAALGGMLQTLAIFLLLLVVRLVWLLLPQRSAATPERPKNLALVAGATAAGLAIGILPIVAGIEMLAQSTRLGSNGYYQGWNHLHWRVLALWFNPRLYGLPADRALAGLNEFGRMYMGGSGWGILGVVPLGLAVFGLVRRAGPARERAFWFGLSILTVGFLLLQATPFQTFLTRLCPWLGDVDLLRGLVVVNLGGALLAGWGAAEAMALWAEHRQWRKWMVPWAGYTAAGLAVLAASRIGPSPVHPLIQDLVPYLLPLAGLIAIALLPTRGRAWAGIRVWLLPLLVAIELCHLHFTLNTFAPAHLTYPSTRAVEELRHRLAEPDHPRYLVQGAVRLLPPNTGSIYGLPDVRGYSNIPIARHRLLLECAEGRRDLQNLPKLQNIDSPIYRLLAVGHVFQDNRTGIPRDVSAWDWGLRRRPSFLSRAFLVHEVERVPGESGLRRVLSDPGFDPAARVYLEETAGPSPPVGRPREPESVRISRLEGNHVRIRVESSAPGILVLSDPYYPGWRARVDGQSTRILPAYGGLRGVAVGAGDHEVIFDYRPWWLLPGTLAMVAGLVFVLAPILPALARVPMRRRLRKPL